MIPLLFVGPPGTGKTAHVKSLYEHTEILLLSSCTEEDISGLPYREKNKERRTMPLFIENIQNAVASGKKTCLFLDEIDKSRQEVADTLLSLVVSPAQFGIPKSVDIYAAANPPEWGGGNGISQPMQTRFSVINWQVNVNSVCDFLLKEYTHLKDLISCIRNGEMPIFESVGEGYDFRLTCPRTIELAFKAIGSPDAEIKINGLLTARAASFLFNFIGTNEDISIAFERSKIVHNAVLPIRL